MTLLDATSGVAAAGGNSALPFWAGHIFLSIREKAPAWRRDVTEAGA